MSRLACRSCRLILLAGNGGGYVDFDQHPGMRKLADIEERMGWPPGAAERFGEALKVGTGGANIGNIGDDLDDVRHRGAVPLFKMWHEAPFAAAIIFESRQIEKGGVCPEIEEANRKSRRDASGYVL